jgi:large subunit ribosomal protein L15
MKIHEVNVSSTKSRKRVGRGIGSGYGKTAGRGTKGQNARTGGGTRPGFEGGQNPLAKRLPKKRGFVPRTRTVYQVVNLVSLETLKDGATVDIEALKKAGLIKKSAAPVKVLGTGSLTKKLTLKVHAASATAVTMIEKAGGKVELVKLPTSPGKKRTRPIGEQGE